MNWLKDYVSHGLSADALAQRLTMAGLEVERVEKAGKDTILECEVTPNRNDCLSMLGIAREVSAITKKKLVVPLKKKTKNPKATIPIRIEDKKGCLQYIGTVIEGVSIADSPKWIQQRISAIGLRAVNNVVDITNFVLMETGQPLHAFDYDKLEGKTILVRRAQKGESIITIDGVERTLDPSILVIADAVKPVAIAGVMGGLGTEVTSETKNILLESAYFDPILIRQASRKLGLSSDSSYRFERGVDPDMVSAASDRARAIILNSAKGAVTQYRNIEASSSRGKQKRIALSLEDVNRLLGANLSFAECGRILKALGFDVAKRKGGAWSIIPPAFRDDIAQSVDLIEEIARVVGYDRLPETLPRISLNNIEENPLFEIRGQIRSVLEAQGFSEAITYALINQTILDRCGQGDKKGFRILNPLSQEQGVMRPTMLPGLLGAVGANAHKNQKNVMLYEIGKIYAKPKEEDVLALIAVGQKPKDWRCSESEAVGFYDMKGVLEDILNLLNIQDAEWSVSSQPFLEAGEQAAVVEKKREIGYLGRISEDIVKGWKLEGPIYFAQIRMHGLEQAAKKQALFEPISEFPSIIRDVSVAVNNSVTYAQIEAIARKLGGRLLRNIRFQELYLGEKIPEGQKGLVFSLEYRSHQRTLKEDEVENVHQEIEKALISELKATRR